MEVDIQLRGVPHRDIDPAIAVEVSESDRRIRYLPRHPREIIPNDCGGEPNPLILVLQLKLVIVSPKAIGATIRIKICLQALRNPAICLIEAIGDLCDPGTGYLPFSVDINIRPVLDAVAIRIAVWQDVMKPTFVLIRLGRIAARKVVVWVVEAEWLGDELLS